MKKTWKKHAPLLISIAVPLIIGAISGFLIRNHVQIYRHLKKPPLAPPSWLFPIVWNILYVLMGISSYRIYRSEDPRRTDALRLYASQLLVNFLWAPVFFRLTAFKLAFLILVALWYMVFQMSRTFRLIDEKAARLQIPYQIWITFAAYLNLGIAILQR